MEEFEGDVRSEGKGFEINLEAEGGIDFVQEGNPKKNVKAISKQEAEAAWPMAKTKKKEERNKYMSATYNYINSFIVNNYGQLLDGQALITDPIANADNIYELVGIIGVDYKKEGFVINVAPYTTMLIISIAKNK